MTVYMDIALKDLCIIYVYFQQVKDGNLAKELKELISEGEKHVKTCLVCVFFSIIVD